MCYTLYYYKNDKLNLKHSNSWEQILNWYYELKDNKAYIRDNEYGVDFINGKWDRTDSLLGWAGGNA